MRITTKIALALIAGLAISAQSQEVGSVSSSFRVFGPNDKIVVTAYDDPRVDGVTCYVSAAKTGGIGGAIGWSEDTSDASIACRGVGPITLKGTLPDQEEVLNEKRSVLFKKLRVVRIYDRKRQVLVYMTYSDKLVDGSPKNSVTAVPLRGSQ